MPSAFGGVFEGVCEEEIGYGSADGGRREGRTDTQMVIVDTLIEYTPRAYSVEERIKWISSKAEGLEGPVDTVGPQFFNEIAKREIGRKHLLDQGCSHFLLMDCDECYLEEELRYGMRVMQERDYDSSACRMRMFLKGPEHEYFPYDNLQAVSFICKLKPDAPLRLACPFAGLLVDPTRRMEPHGNLLFFDRGSVEMYHYTFVRMDMGKKLRSVSNKANYDDAEGFLQAFEKWTPADGVIHPHPNIGAQFTHIRSCPNYFGIDLRSICPVCYLSACEAHRK